jgi:lupus La protein
VIAKEVDARSLYVRPFPMDTSIDQIMTLFSTHVGVNGVRLRRHPTSKAFKGSAFVEFESVEAMQKVMIL